MTLPILLALAIGAMNLPDALAYRGKNGTQSAYAATQVVLKAKPFNRLNIWTYLAFAFIVIAVSTVFGYMIYTWCYSARRRNYSAQTRAAKRIGAVRLNSTKRTGLRFAKGMNFGFAEEKAPEDGNWDDPKIAVELESERSWVKRTTLDMKKLCSPDQSTTEEIIPKYRPQSSDTDSLSPQISEFPFESSTQYISALPPAHTNERAATDVPFHLPPPPSSPTLTHKKFVERQRLQYYRNTDVSCSPASPTPYLFNNISPSNLSPSSTASTLPKISTRGESNLIPKKAKSSAADIKLSRFANPFTNLSTKIRRNDSKLSPISPSVMTQSSGSIVSEDYFSIPVTSNTQLLPKGYERDDPHPDSHVFTNQHNNRF